jgi:hypothetical protein
VPTNETEQALHAGGILSPFFCTPSFTCFTTPPKNLNQAMMVGTLRPSQPTALATSCGVGGALAKKPALQFGYALFERRFLGIETVRLLGEHV